MDVGVGSFRNGGFNSYWTDSQNCFGTRYAFQAGMKTTLNFDNRNDVLLSACLIMRQVTLSHPCPTFKRRAFGSASCWN